MKKNKKLKIQSIEEYVIEYGIPKPIKNIHGFPDLFKTKLEKNKMDDMSSKDPILNTSPAINLYASLLTVSKQNKKETNESDIENDSELSDELNEND